jgi:endonuclease/exonuclease/phosphatase (EEP) superfamily protein YafD
MTARSRTFITKLKTLSLFILLLAVFNAGCVSIPQQTQIIQKGCEQQGTQTIASAGNPPLISSSSPFYLPPSQLNSESFSILNWNIYKGQEENWDVDLLRLSEDQDIVLLQEASLNEKLLEILNDRDLCWWLNNAFIYKGVETGVMVASKAQPLDSFGLRHIEPLIRVPKTILINRYPLSGTSSTLLVANIHGINFTLGTDSYKKQLEEMQKILSTHSGPLLVVGDFNNWSNERTKIMNAMAHELSLTRLEYENSSKSIRFGGNVDHVFYRGLVLLSHASIQVSSSDHNPITAQFRVIEPKTVELVQ